MINGRWFKRFLAGVITIAGAMLILSVIALANIVIDATASNTELEKALVEEAAAAEIQARAAKEAGEENTRLLLLLEGALTDGSDATKTAILSVVNDSRRIHGCKVVESFAELAGAPNCEGVVTRASPVTTVTTVRPPVTTTPTTAPRTTTTTVAPPPSAQCAVKLLGLCIG